MSKFPKRATGRALVPTKAAGVPAEIAGEIATTRDGRDITRPWLQELEEFRDRRLLGAVDWGVYDRILLDDQVKSCMAQRISAVVSREWSVLPGDDKDPRSVDAAEALEANLERLDWDGITEKMLYFTFYGVARAELIWEVRDGLIQWGDIKVRHARRFREDKDGRLRLITNANMRGEIMPERKFWSVKTGASDDDQPYGRGLAEWLYWPCLFKRNGIRFWNLFLDRFSLPPAKAIYPRGASDKEIGKVLDAMVALANDSGIAVPEGFVLDFMQVATQGIEFENMPKYMDGCIAKVILSQTMTTDDGSSKAQGQVHAGVKQELVTADADLSTGSFNRGPARWFTDLNFGADVAAPILVRQVEEEEDTKATAETDKMLAEIGWHRTAESVRDIYGEGFEYREPKKPDLGSTPDLTNQKHLAAPAKAISFAAGERRSLYVHRRLRNAKDLIAWARAQGFKSAVAAAEMHVTVAYSRRPVDWFEMGQAWGEADGGLTVAPGGPRQVEPLGREGAIVLLFASNELAWRNQDMRDRGAEWSFADYHPHITITYDGAGVDLAKIEAYQGELRFGPEIFEPIDDQWESEIEEVCFAEAPSAAVPDIVDEATQAIMADEGWRQVAVDLGVQALIEELGKAADQDAVNAILARAAEFGDAGKLVESIARSGFAVRMAAAAGVDGASA